MTLAKRIRSITTLRDALTFLHDDGLAALATHMNDPHAIFFLDPPYTAGKHGKQAGKRLYTHAEATTLLLQQQGVAQVTMQFVDHNEDIFPLDTGQITLIVQDSLP
jgi:16S rRNA G966 N2-methylase RsmD